MTLDDIEKLARDVLDEDEAYEAASYHENALVLMHRKPTRDIARALLAVVPVVRAAESWHAVNTGQHTNGPQHTLAMRDTRNALVDAVEAMRAEIGGEG